MAVLWLCTSATAEASPPEETTTTTTVEETTTSLPPTTTTSPSGVLPSYDSFDPCTPQDSTVSLSEWAACSTAYNTDKMRQTVTVALFLLVALTTGLFLVLALRR